MRIHFSALTAPQSQKLQALVQDIENQLEAPAPAGGSDTSPYSEADQQRIEKMREWLKSSYRGDNVDQAILSLRLMKETGYEMTDTEKGMYEKQLETVNLNAPVETYLRNQEYKQNTFTVEEAEQLYIQKLLKRVASHTQLMDFVTFLEKQPKFPASDALVDAVAARLSEFKAQLANPKTNASYVHGIFNRFTRQSKIAQDIESALKELEPSLAEQDIQAAVKLAAKRYSHLDTVSKFPTGEILLLTEPDSYSPVKSGYFATAVLVEPGNVREVAISNEARGGSTTWFTLDGKYKVKLEPSRRQDKEIKSRVNDLPFTKQVDCSKFQK